MPNAMLSTRWIILLSTYFLNDSTALSSDCEFPFCANGANCADDRCAGCPFNCVRTRSPQCITESERCKVHCVSSSTGKGCKDCIYSKPRVDSDSMCPLGSFRDVTESIFSGEDSNYWFDWLSPGTPKGHFSSPTMVDINGDSILDYFTPMHGANLKDERFTNARMQLGETVMNDSTDPYLRDIHARLILEDDWEDEATGFGSTMDKHGEVVADLDNDGILDIFIVSGGGKGGKSNAKVKSRNNVLLFGEQVKDERTGQNITIFRGGRTRAEESGIEGENGRGRFSYLLDVNQDGLLDIFIGQPRREDNFIAPGNLYINNGDRTWTKQENVAEFSEAMILTDADGDSIAEELLMFRGYCFPRRSNPDADKTWGPFSQEAKDFCSTRPVGSTVIYKFNQSTQQMEEMSPKYHNVSSRRSMQPECCSHGVTESYESGCSAVSIASADFDGDEISDHVVLYARKMVFFFSSDRPEGELPIQQKYIGLTIDLPGMCTNGMSMQLFDMDNSGKLDIIVMCSNAATFLIYSQGESKDSWNLREDCHGNGSLGDIVLSSYEITQHDIDTACNKIGKEARVAVKKKIKEVCNDAKEGTLKAPKQNGVTFADINNDGFVDAIVGTKYGYQKWFIYQPSPESSGNRHISFKLVGDGKNVNIYGIGATLILHSLNTSRLEKNTQFREISSHQHISDKGGHKDEKITFGLGKELKPVKIVSKWPNGVEQTLWLTHFDPEVPVNRHPAIDIKYQDVHRHFKIRNENPGVSGDQLCLTSAIYGGIEKKAVTLEKCSEVNLSKADSFSFKEDGMVKSNLYPGYCLSDQDEDNFVFLRKCEDAVERKISWHQTKDGFIRLSGSNIVLNGVEGEKPILVEMDDAQERQRWVLDETERLSCDEMKNKAEFFWKMVGSKPYTRKCRWLMKQNVSKIVSVCHNFLDSYDGRGPARDVCCDTCAKYSMSYITRYSRDNEAIPINFGPDDDEEVSE